MLLFVPQVTPESLLLHYFSNRPGLWPIVVGVLKGMSNDYFKLDLQVGVESFEGLLVSAFAPGVCAVHQPLVGGSMNLLKRERSIGWFGLPCINLYLRVVGTT